MAYLTAARWCGMMVSASSWVVSRSLLCIASPLYSSTGIGTASSDDKAMLLEIILVLHEALAQKVDQSRLVLGHS